MLYLLSCVICEELGTEASLSKVGEILCLLKTIIFSLGAPSLETFTIRFDRALSSLI